MKKIASISIIVIIFVALIFAVVYFGGKKDKSSISQSKKPVVVASFYPLYYFASQIAGDKMEVINIGRGNDPHEFKPSTKDVVTMHKASIVLLQGAGLESWGEDLEKQLKKEKIPVFVVAKHLKLFKFDEYAHEHESDKESHQHGSYDPHTWLSPVLVKETVLQIAKEFEKINPKNKEIYQKNAQILADKLDKIDKDYKNTLINERCSVDKALVSHNAFGYIGRQYELKMYPIAGISTLDKPSAKLLAQLKNEAKEGVIAILTEENSVKEYAETIAKETGITIIPINTLATGVMQNGGDYIDGMYFNLENFKKAYGCK